MFTIESDKGIYAMTFDTAPEGLSDVKEGDEVTVTYTGELSEVDAFTGTIISVVMNSSSRGIPLFRIAIPTARSFPTIPFHQRVLKNAAFLKGEYDTTFTQNDKKRASKPPTEVKSSEKR